MAYRSTSSFSNNEQEKARKKGLFSKVFGSGSNRPDDYYQSTPQSIRVGLYDTLRTAKLQRI